MITLLWRLHQWFKSLESFQVAVLVLLLLLIFFVSMDFFRIEHWLQAIYLQGRK